MQPNLEYRNNFPVKSAILRNLLTVSPDIPIASAIAQMAQAGLTSASQTCTIVEEQHKIVGILTRQDIIQLIAGHVTLEETTVRAVMSTPVITLKESEIKDYESVLTLLKHHRISHLPVVTETMELAGLLTQQSVQQVYLNHFVNAAPHTATSLAGKSVKEEVSRLNNDEPDRNEHSLDGVMHHLTEKTLTSIGINFFPELIRHLAPSLKVSHAFITEKVDTQLKMLAFWAHGDLQEPMAYQIAKTPLRTHPGIWHILLRTFSTTSISRR